MPYFFEKGHDVYALNWRGCGKSECDKDFNAVSLADHVQDLRNVRNVNRDLITSYHYRSSGITFIILTPMPLTASSPILSGLRMGWGGGTGILVQFWKWGIS